MDVKSQTQSSWIPLTDGGTFQCSQPLTTSYDSEGMGPSSNLIEGADANDVDCLLCWPHSWGQDF